MADIKSKPVVYTYGPEGRDACWAALTKSWNELAKRQKSSTSDKLTARTTTTGGAQETNEIDSTTPPPRGTVAAMEMATTPPPPPMMRSPPRLERRAAGGGPHHRRRSQCNDWDTPKGHCDGAADHSFRPYDLSNLLQECMRPSPDLALADSCCDRDHYGYRSRFDWNDDVAAAAAVAQPVREQRRPSSSRVDDEDGTPAPLPSLFPIEEAPTTVSTAAATADYEDEDEDEVITLVEDVATAAAPVVENDVTATVTVVQDVATATATVIQDVATATAPVVQDEITATAPVVQDEVTATAPVVEDVATGDAPDPTLPTGAVDEARDELQTVDKPSQPLPLPWTAGYRETRIQEIDDNIVSYSKSLLITVLVVVLIRVLF